MDLPKRKKLRLVGYDYSQDGLYFITICTKDKACLLGEIVGQGLCPCRLSPIGEIVEREVNNIPMRFEGVLIDKYVIMPNHVHMILNVQRQARRQGQSPCPTDYVPSSDHARPTIGSIIGAMKSVSTKAANDVARIPGRKLWQFRFHDHIIRNEAAYQKIWQYIEENPQYWQQDCFFVS